MRTYHAIGLMSGTSLDGLDMAFCRFNFSSKQQWEWKLLDCETLEYPKELKSQLGESKSLGGLALHLLDVELGKWMGAEVKGFIEAHGLTVDFIASHGHTVFHSPEDQLTLQIGNPNFIHATTGCPVISDFRTLDLAKKGQGAPLVPIGDELLFGEYDGCINLGGIANLSYKNGKGERLAYDICACNILLNALAKLKGVDFDDKGNIGKSGVVIASLLKQWNNFSFLKKEPPKSLGIELIEPAILSEISPEQYSTEDMMATAVEHISSQISISLKALKKGGQVLLTGGGAFNDFLIHRLRSKLNDEYKIHVADPKLVNYKEALVFAFLGVLNVRNEFNTLSSVTGAPSNSVSGQKLGDI